MKLPRDVGSTALERALRRELGYEFSRQVGSHRRLTTQRGGEHHVTIPAHNPMKPGTLRAILREVSGHHGIEVEELIGRLGI